MLDNPTLVHGLGWPDSPAHKVVSAAVAGRFVPVTSPVLLDELERTLRRHELAGVFSKPKRLVALVARMCMVVEPIGRLEVVERTAGNRLLEAAQTAGATYLVTGDIPLLQLGEFRGTRIVRPL